MTWRKADASRNLSISPIFFAYKRYPQMLVPEWKIQLQSERVNINLSFLLS